MADSLPIRTHASKVIMPNVDTLEARVHELQDRWHVPGISIAIIYQNEINSKGYGKATLNPSKPCTAGTLFDIASCSKSLTAAAVALLVEDESYPQVQWNAKMCALMSDDFVMSEDSYTRDITVEDILSHRTGLPSHDQSYLGVRAKHPDTPRSVTRNLRNLQVTEPIRTKFQYCNMLFTVATHLIETVSGMSFDKFLHIKFFEPLGMASSHLQPPAAIAAGLKDRIATGYRWLEDSEEYRIVPWQHMPEAQGAGQIITSAADYAKYVKALMNQEAPMSKAVYDGVTRPRIVDGPDTEEDDMEPFTSLELYAAGWGVRWYRGYKIVQHDGGVPGFGSTHFFVPGIKFGGVILGNADNAGNVAGIISRELIDEALGVPKDERVDWDAYFVEAKKKYEEGKESVAKLFCPELGELQPLQTPLGQYVGTYWNLGYREMVVEIREGKLFIDASDRSMGFYVTLEHVCDENKFIGHLEDRDDGTEEDVPVQFKCENGRIVCLGMKDEQTFDEYVWYDRKPLA